MEVLSNLQKLRKELFDKLNDVQKAKAAYDFVMGNDVMQTKPAPLPGYVPNGVYIVYNDGTYIPFSSDAPKDNAKFVGVAYNGHTFGVFRKVGDYKLLPSTNIPKDDLCQDEYQALIDWDFVKHTDHIFKLGCEIPLVEGEYLPTAPMFVVIANLANQGLNDALKHIGLDPIDLDGYYWFAQRCNASFAWYFYGAYGSLYGFTVTNVLTVQAVVLWNP